VRKTHVELSLTEDGLQRLQDECEEFNFELDEFLSYVIMAVVYEAMDRNGKGDPIYHKINWKKLRERGLCV